MLQKGEKMNESVNYYYPRNKDGQRMGHSIAVIQKEGKVFVGFSLLGKGDKFNRKIGRAIAESRARKQIEQYENRKNNPFTAKN